jgi:hypothetical protein
MSDPQEKLAIVVTPLGPIMGSLVDKGDAFLLKKPRALSVTPAGDGMLRFNLSALIGRPDEMVFTGDIAYWTTPDQNVVKTYLESISDIKIVINLPPRTKAT